MITATESRADNRDLRAAFTAARARLGLVIALFAVAIAGWWWTAGQMRGMDDGPWTHLGGITWFLSVWVVMMAAMMFPSIAPTVALQARMTQQRSPLLPVAFVGGYLVTWTAAGTAALAVGGAVGAVSGGVLEFDRAGRWIAGATLVVAAVYELTPLKDVCLGKCRSPLGFLLGAWRDGVTGALQMGMKNGAWCVGCCWALMASLFALGIMSVFWMAVVAGVIAVQKMVPWPRVAAYGAAVVLAVLAGFVLIAPTTLPWLTTPASGGAMQM
jgi:predicted metal-binding membrane protein